MSDSSLYLIVPFPDDTLFDSNTFNVSSFIYDKNDRNKLQNHV